MFFHDPEEIKTEKVIVDQKWIHVDAKPRGIGEYDHKYCNIYLKDKSGKYYELGGIKDSIFIEEIDCKSKTVRLGSNDPIVGEAYSQLTINLDSDEIEKSVKTYSCRKYLKDKKSANFISIDAKEKIEFSNIKILEEIPSINGLLIAGYYVDTNIINCRSGELKHLQLRPVWSPDYTRFAVIGYFAEEGYGVAQIWHVQNDKFILEWESPKGGDNPSWETNEKLRFLNPDNMGEGEWKCEHRKSKWNCKSK